MSPSQNDFFRRAIRLFDRILDRQLLARLGPEALSQVLQELERFHQQARRHQPMTERPLDEPTFLVAAGCRLSSDLNEAVYQRLVDQVQHHEASIAQLSQALSQQLQAREETLRLLRKSQALKEQTVETGETVGLGMVL